MTKKLTQQEAERKIRDYDNEYELISTYTKSTNPIKLKHRCGHEYIVKAYKHFMEGGNKCPKCYPIIPHRKSTKQVTVNDIIQRIKNQTGDEYSYLSGYVNTKIKMNIKHNKCGNVFQVTADMFLGKKQSRCPLCSNKNRGKYAIKENYLNSLLENSNDGSEYQWLEEYKNDNKMKLTILHKTCNRSYLVRPNDFQQGYRCPHCSIEKNESYHVSYIKDFLNKNKIIYDIEIMFDNLIYKNNLKFDFKINDLIIEFDGVQHFKPTFTEEDYCNTKIRDSIKNQWIKNQSNYSLLRIPFKISFDSLEEILIHVENNDINEKLINKYNLYYSDSKKNILYNENKYYTNINKNYFTE